MYVCFGKTPEKAQKEAPQQETRQNQTVRPHLYQSRAKVMMMILCLLFRRKMQQGEPRQGPGQA